MSHPTSQVEQVQGLYGPFQFPELLFQRIWAEQAFNTKGLCTESGQRLHLRHPGDWNRQGGPDFRRAEIELDGQSLHGDIELHLYEQDWTAHGHSDDPAYDKVILHVVLFPCRRPTTSISATRQLPVLVLLPQLWHDLEEYAADAAIAGMARRPVDRLAASWLELSAADCRERIVAAARQRWRGKVHYARLRLERFGWTAACHHTALEILGYRANRAPMLAVATAHPLADWCEGRVVLDEVYAEQAPRWQVAGVRPPNQPRRRLTQYARWIEAGGDWPTKLAALGADWPRLPDGLSAHDPVSTMRRELDLGTRWREVMQALGIADIIKRPRADNLWGDGLLPLLAAAEHLPEATAFLYWFAAWPGDQADTLRQAARLAGLAEPRRNPLSWGHVQGLLHEELSETKP